MKNVGIKLIIYSIDFCSDLSIILFPEDLNEALIIRTSEGARDLLFIVLVENG